MDKIIEYLESALKNIRGNKMRTGLTMLGIIIGVAAVIILVSIVAGYMGQMVEQFEEMGVNKINSMSKLANTISTTAYYIAKEKNYTYNHFL